MSLTKTPENNTPIERKFIEVTRSKGDSSSIWNYFLREVNGDFAKCNQGNCTKLIKAIGGSTTGMREHLKRVHKIEVPTTSNRAEYSGR